MHVFVTIPNDSKKLTLEVSPGDLVRELKVKSEDKSGTPTESLLVEYDGAILDDNRTLESYNITHETVVHLKSNGFQIFVKTVTGRSITIDDVTSHMTILELKEKFAKKEGVDVESIRFIFCGKQLSQDDSPVSEYRVTARATLMCVLRLKGGLKLKLL